MKHTPRKRFSQNFLRDTHIIENIIALIEPRMSDHMVEIGPGLGALTFALLPQVSHLDAVELDRDLVEQLSSHNHSKLTVFSGDALSFDFGSLNKKPLRIVGNLPYNISTPLIFHLMKFLSIIQDMYFMLQKEVVERLSAEVDTEHYGRLSVMTQYYCEVTSMFDVPPTAFYPVPKVDSAIVRLQPHASLPYTANNVHHLSNLVQKAFAQRRKTLWNNLKGSVSELTFEKLGIDPKRRAETLSIKEFVQLANSMEC